VRRPWPRWGCAHHPRPNQSEVFSESLELRAQLVRPCAILANLEILVLMVLIGMPFNRFQLLFQFEESLGCFAPLGECKIKWGKSLEDLLHCHAGSNSALSAKELPTRAGVFPALRLYQHLRALGGTQFISW
jgi:hypothetical protein